MSSPYPILTLASARSGTRFLADFFARNVPEVYSTHEPYLTPGNPTLFGPAIAWNAHENDERLLPLLEQKCRFIRSRRAPWYFEANHAVVKAFHRHLPSLLPEAGFIHLVRNPQRVAKSEMLREQVIRRSRLSAVDYKTDRGQRLFRWSLTGDEPLFAAFAERAGRRLLTRYGFYVLQWFEVEHRIHQLLQAYGRRARVFCVDVDRQLNQPEVLGALLDCFGIPSTKSFNLNLHRNKTLLAGSSVPSDAEHDEYQFILRHLPDSYRQVMSLPIYARSSFSAALIPEPPREAQSTLSSG